MNYKIIFDLSEDGLRNWQVVIIPVVILIVVAIDYFRKKNVSKKAKYATLVGVLLIVIQFIVSFYFIVWRYFEYSYKIKSGDYSVAEGRVSNFKIHQDESQNGIESFMVGNKKFAYQMNPFNFSFDYPGILHDSMQVRLCYSGVYILKLEVVK